jgi:nicotinate-nucleotide adenylyltransferase
MRKERIGIFGGTFNPIHSGHVRAAAEVQKRFSLDRVLFIPSSVPPHKTTEEIAPARDRMRMVELALRRRRRLVPSPIEVREGGTSYSILTLRRIKQLHPRAWIFFVLGADAFLEIETWREWKRVLEQCLFIVMTRPGFRLGAARGVLGNQFREKILDVRPSARVRESWFAAFRVFCVAIPALDVSSTDIRRRVRQGKSVRTRVPRAVEQYIKDHRLYLKRRPEKQPAHGH